MLNQPVFAQCPVLQYALWRKDGKIQRYWLLQDEFAQIAAHRRSLLQAMTGKAVGQI